MQTISKYLFFVLILSCLGSNLKKGPWAATFAWSSCSSAGPELLMGVLWQVPCHNHTPRAPLLWPAVILRGTPAKGGPGEAEGIRGSCMKSGPFPRAQLTYGICPPFSQKEIAQQVGRANLSERCTVTNIVLKCHFLQHIHTIKFYYSLNFHSENGCHKSMYKLFTSLLNEGLSKNCHRLSICSMTWDTIDNVTNIFNIKVIL